MDWFIGKSKRKLIGVINKSPSPPPPTGKENEDTFVRHNTNPSSHSADGSKGYSNLDDDTGAVCTWLINLDAVAYDSLVRLPSGVDVNEWLASNSVMFFANINNLYGSLSCQFCTADRCPLMNGVNAAQYSWQKSRCSAPQYIDLVMTYIESLICDEHSFPTRYGNNFTDTFLATCTRPLYRYLWHVLSHLLAAHRSHLARLGLELPLLAIAAHFRAFGDVHSLFDEATSIELRALDTDTNVLADNQMEVQENNLMVVESQA